jgi:hypothetical protein
MEPTFQPLEPASTPSVEVRPAETKTSGVRRAVLTAAIAGLLLVAGGVAVVSAASPDPSASPSTAAPSVGTTAPSDGTTTPRTHSGTRGDCPDKAGGTDGADGTDDSGGYSTTPSTTPSTVPTPAT